MKSGGDGEWSEIGRTEVVANNLNPRFVTLIPAVRPSPSQNPYCWPPVQWPGGGSAVSGVVKYMPYVCACVNLVKQGAYCTSFVEVPTSLRSFTHLITRLRWTSADVGCFPASRPRFGFEPWSTVLCVR